MASKLMAIPDALLARYILAKKTVHPIPLDSETGEPLWTDIQWILQDASDMIKTRIATLESKARAKANVVTPITEVITFT